MGYFSPTSPEAQAVAAFNAAKTVAALTELSVDSLGGAIAFETEKDYEKHVKAHGKPASYDDAKELFAKLSANFIDHEVEKRGGTAEDRQEFKKITEDTAKAKFSHAHYNTQY